MTAPTRVAHHFVSGRARPALSPLLLLIVGVVLIAFTFMRYSVPAIAWVAFAPFLPLATKRTPRFAGLLLATHATLAITAYVLLLAWTSL